MPKLKIMLDDNEYLLLSGQFISLLYKQANAEYIKVYLCALDLASKNGRRTSSRSIAEELSMPQQAVDKALVWCSELGMLAFLPDGGVEFGAMPEAKQRPAAKKLRGYPHDTSPSYSSAEVASVIESNNELSQMFSLAQTILGRTLSASSISVLYSLYDWLGMSPEVILMLLEHCAEIGKKDMRYIEKVAISWHEMGIDSTDAADAYIKAQNARHKYGYKIKKILGIEGRNFTASEQRYIDLWHETLDASPKLVAAAFDYCVKQTGKLSFAYMNKVLESWHKDGIKTPEQAAQSIERFNASRKPAASGAKSKLEIYHSGRYDYDKIEKLAGQKMKNKLRRNK